MIYGLYQKTCFGNFAKSSVLSAHGSIVKHRDIITYINYVYIKNNYYVATRLLWSTIIDPGKIFENMLQLEPFGLYILKEFCIENHYFHIEVIISATYRDARGIQGHILRENL